MVGSRIRPSHESQHPPRSSRPRRPARPLIWMYSPEVSQRKPPPSNLRALVNTTVLAGMLRPVEKVSVANSTCAAMQHLRPYLACHRRMPADAQCVCSTLQMACRDWLKTSMAQVAHLDEVLLEQDLDDLLQDGQQPAVVHAHAALQHGQQRAHLHARGHSHELSGPFRAARSALHSALSCMVHAPAAGGGRPRTGSRWRSRRRPPPASAPPSSFSSSGAICSASASHSFLLKLNTITCAIVA